MKLTLCADDFALSRPISETIVDLADRGKVNAISCMAAMPGWEADCALLSSLPRNVEIGLHIVLTEIAPLTSASRLAPSGHLPLLARFEHLARRHQLPLAEVRAEVEAQIERFAVNMGRAPDFVDGHQHVHVVGQAREAVLDVVARCAPSAWVRNCSDAPTAILARPFRLKAIGSAYHSRGLERQAGRRGLRSNRGFSGHYGFAGDYTLIFPRFLVRPGPDHLIMCHPGAGRCANDSIADARVAEAQALRRLPVRDLAAAAGLQF
jgi:hypothetical protein